METLFENKTTHVFGNKTSESPSPFYTKDNQMFYKNKLISVEDIIHTKDCSHERKGEFSKHFSIYKPTIEYILTFEDQYGNTHSLTSDSKPKKINELFYYIIEDNHLIYITHETDKTSLKDFIDINDIDDTDYNKVPDKMFKLGCFFDRHEKPICILSMIIIVSILPLVFLGLSWGNYTATILGFAALPSLVFALEFREKCLQFSYYKKDQITSEKKDAILKSFT